MNTNRPGARRGLVGTVILCLLLLRAASVSVGAWAQPSGPQADEPQSWPEAETVRALMRADAAAALAECRMPGFCEPAAEPSARSQPLPRSADEVRLAAIYGVARRLTVDLMVNGSLVRYQAGRSAPIAGAVSADAYQLLAIDGACVRLRRAQQDHTACLQARKEQP